jgi:hypothetical protein
MKKLIYLSVLASLLILSNSIFGQVSNELEKSISSNDYPKHAIDLKIAFGDHSVGGVSVGAGLYNVDVGTGGVGGFIRYNYYPNSDYAFTFTTGAMASAVRVETFSSYTSTVIPIMMGMKYYFAEVDKNNTLRPYLSGSMGTIIGTEAGVDILYAGTHTENAFGVNAGFGADIILGSLVKLHADIGYNLYSDFKEPIGGRNNYSGAEFSFGIGFMF